MEYVKSYKEGFDPFITGPSLGHAHRVTILRNTTKNIVSGIDFYPHPEIPECVVTAWDIRGFGKASISTLTGGAEWHGEVVRSARLATSASSVTWVGTGRRASIIRVEVPITQCLRSLVPETNKRMAFGTRVFKHWVTGPSG